MKKKLAALVCALAMAVSLAGCVFSTPDSVGKLGDIDISSGLYLLAQYSAYQQAAQLAGDDQDVKDVKSFLKSTITTDADTGETAVVSDYVADKTMENLRTYAAVESRFDELGGQLTEQQETAADNFAQQLMDNYGDEYTANGIGLETLKRFTRIQTKHTALLELIYGADGETPVSDSELTSHLNSQMYEIAYVSIPLYNTSTYAFADDDQKAEMLQLAQAAADSYNAAIPESADDQIAALTTAVEAALPDIYNVVDATYTAGSNTVQTELLTESDLTSAFTQDGAADAVRKLEVSHAAAVQYTGYSLILMVRLDPLSVNTLDDVRSQVLSDLKGAELNDALDAYGAELTSTLSSSAMNKMPASKIVNS